MSSFESLSSWQPPPVPEATDQRRNVLEALAGEIASRGPGRLRVAIDGYPCAGKSSFSRELAEALIARTHTVLRASLDDFKKPWRDAHQKGYDRVSGPGYYRNAPDFESARRLLLEPAGPGGSGRVVLCAHDPLTGEDHRHKVIEAPPGTVLLVDGMFALRPEYDGFWDYRIWLDIAPEESLRRGIARDTPLEGREGAESLHRDRYHTAMEVYIEEVDPVSKADAVVDNSDFKAPTLRGH